MKVKMAARRRENVVGDIENVAGGAVAAAKRMAYSLKQARTRGDGGGFYCM